MEGLIQIIVGLVVLGVIVGVINLLLQLFYRLAHGPERIEAMVIVIRPDAVQKYAPNAISATADGASTFDFRILFSALFSHVAEKERSEKWTKSAKMYVAPVTQDVEVSSDFAIQTAVKLLQQKRFAPQSDKFGKAYSVASRLTAKPLTAYLVLVGNIPPSAPSLEIG